MKVKHSQVPNLLKQIKVPVMLHGTFGIGKSYIVREYARSVAAEKGLRFSENPADIDKDGVFCLIRLPLHQLDAAELKGIPYPSENRDKTIFLPMGLLPTRGDGVLFLDEINLAPPLVQGNAYQLVLDRQLGFYSVPDGYTIIAAGNTDADRAHTFDMPMPLRNRFAHLFLSVPTYEEWAEWASAAGIDSRIIYFLGYRRDYLYGYDPDSESVGMQIPTPRTWEFASKNIFGVNDPEMLRYLVGCVVGEGIGYEFAAWVELSHQFNIEEIYKTEEVEIPNKVDVLYSLMSAIVAYYVDNPTKENANKLFNISLKFQREHTMMMLSYAARKDKSFISKIDNKKIEKYADELIAIAMC